MNCHQHEFSSSQQPEGRSNKAVASIHIHHNVSQPLSTSYEFNTTRESPEERKRRAFNHAMARAMDITRRFGGGKPQTVSKQQSVGKAESADKPQSVDKPQGLPVARPVPQPLTAEVTRVSTSRKRVSEPGFLALNGTFRRSSSSLLASQEFLRCDSTDSDGIPKGIPPPPPLKTEVTSLLLSLDSRPTNNNFHPAEELFDMTSSDPPVISGNPAPTLYPELTNDQQEVADSRTDDNEGGLLRGLAIDSQAHLLEQYLRPETRPQQTAERRTTAIEEQENLWRQLSNSHLFASNSSPRSVTRMVSPLEEQALLWEQLRNTMPTSNVAVSPSRQTSVIEEQAQLLQNCSRQRSPTALSAVEEQARILEEVRIRRPVDPIEEQAQRWEEIQDAKERKILEMVCQMSQATSLDVHDRRGEEEEELSLRCAIEMSRCQAQNQESPLEEALLRVAMQKSEDEMGISMERHLAATLACQTSDQIRL